MKTTQLAETNATVRQSFATTCLASCRKLIAQIEKTKTAILNEFRGAFSAPEQLLHLALNEAEALAWQTEYPYLVFPELAVEKVQSVAAWQIRQRSIRRQHFVSALAV